MFKTFVESDPPTQILLTLAVVAVIIAGGCITNKTISENKAFDKGYASYRESGKLSSCYGPACEECK